MTKSSQGFTLIEVLIALAILSIAMTAIIRVTSQDIKNTMYLQNKTIASWVGTQVINEVRIGLRKLSSEPDQLEETIMLGQTWSWQGQIIPTPNPHIKKIKVEVFEKSSQLKLISLESYLYAAQ